jgi:hypothetical protein
MRHPYSLLQWLIVSSALAACGGTTTTVADAGAGADVAADDRPDVTASCALPGGGVCRVGETCPSPDGCNTCGCSAGGLLACTALACIDASVPDVPAVDAPAVDVSVPDASAVDVPAVDVPAVDVPAVFCALRSGARCPAGMSCPAGDGCNECACSSTGVSTCTARPCAFDAGQTRPTCFSNIDCNADEECAGSPGCATPWTCRPATGRFCPPDLAPFCGCDGRTFYASSRCPPSPYASVGACGAPDAGSAAGVDCAVALVACGGIKPMCPSGTVHRIDAACWGPCVPFGTCAPIDCDPASSRPQCPEGTACSTSARRCIDLVD